MVSRVFCIPGIVLLFAAVVVSFLASISLPFLPALDVTRVEFNNTGLVQDGMTNMRFGIWTACYYNEEGDRTCQKNGIAYETTIAATENDKEITVGKSWTRGLVIQPIATGVTVIALCLSFSSHLLVTLVTSLVAFLAAVMHLISFFVMIALFAHVKSKVNGLDIEASTKPSSGFWMVFACMLLCLLAGCTVCFGRRREKGAAAPSVLAAPTPADSALPTEKNSGFLSRFRRDKTEV